MVELIVATIWTIYSSAVIREKGFTVFIPSSKIGFAYIATRFIYKKFL